MIKSSVFNFYTLKQLKHNYRGINLNDLTWQSNLIYKSNKSPILLPSIEVGNHNQYDLDVFKRSNQDTCLMHKPLTIEGNWVQSGDALTDCASSVGGELSLGQNLLIAYMPWEGYNFEDAILISERLVMHDLYTSVHIERYELQIQNTKLGSEEITRQIPDVPETELNQLDSFGIIKVGSWVEEGNILVGKTTLPPSASHPYGSCLHQGSAKQVNNETKKKISAYEKLLYAILEKQVRLVKDTSLRAPKGIKAKVIHIQYFLTPLLCGFTPGTSNTVYNIKKHEHSEFINGVLKKTAKTVRSEQKINKKQSYECSWLRSSHITKEAANFKLRKKQQFLKTLWQFFYNCSAPLVVQSKHHYGLRSKEQSTLNLKSLSEKFKNHKKHFSDLTYLTYKSNKSKLNKRHGSLLSYESKYETPTCNCNSLIESNKTHTITNLLNHKTTWFLLFKLWRSLKYLKYLKYQYKKKTFNENNNLKPPININNMACFASKQRNLTNVNFVTGNKLVSSETNPFVCLAAQQASAKQPSKLFTPGLASQQNKTQSMKNVHSIHVYLAEKRKIQVGDKMAGRHGNKGIISKILPLQDMPFLPDGTPVDMVLNPLGVPSRMNVGQIYECLLALAGHYLAENYKVSVFDEIFGPEASRSFVLHKLNQAGMKTGFKWLFDPNSPGKIPLCDGRNGEFFDQKVTVGKAYMLRLVHMVDDKIHTRSTGPYSLVTQQPLRGRSKQGGQRLGEMEVWALEGYGAAFTLLEMLTLKSDDMTGRMTLWSNLILNKNISIGTAESFKVLVCELQALCLDVTLLRYDSAFTNQNSLKEVNSLINLP